MSTIAQIEANRANAAHSTGPRTEDGKLASSANSTKTGLTAARIFVRPDERDEFDAFSQALDNEFLPAGHFQNHLFDSILHAAWNIRRCMLLEDEIQNEAIAKGLPDALLDDELSKKLDRIYRYKKMHEATRGKSIAELRKLQSEQTWREHNEITADESILTDMPKVGAGTFKFRTLKAQATLAEFDTHLRVQSPVRNEAKPSPRAGNKAA